MVKQKPEVVKVERLGDPQLVLFFLTAGIRHGSENRNISGEI